MPRSRRLAGAVLTLAAAALAGPSRAQPVPATNDVAACSLLADPTAQRSCIESARQKRAASSFDPSATRSKAPRARAQDGDVTGLRRSTDAGRRPRRSTGSPAPAADQPAQIP